MVVEETTTEQRILNVAGFNTSSGFIQAKNALVGLATIFPKNFQVIIKECKASIHDSN
jgi:hypothetical protein